MLIYNSEVQNSYIDSFHLKIMRLNQFESPGVPKARAIKTGINFMAFILIFVENCNCNTTKNMFFLVWLRTGSHPADINRFRSKLLVKS